MAGGKRRRPVLNVLTVLPIIVLAILAIACEPKAEAGEKIRVVVSILPQAEFVEGVGGDKVDVTVMVPPGASPHTYEVTPSQMAALSKAQMYAKVGSGIDFELVWMDRLVAANMRMLVVDCSKGVELIEMAGDENGGAMDPHIWMSPVNAKIMVRNICDGLTQVDSSNKAYYEENRDVYLQKLSNLDQDIEDGLSRVTNRTFMVYHPSFGYFAKRYNLTMLPIEEEGKEPTAAGIAHLVQQANEHNTKVIFASPQFNPQSARVIADEIGGRVVFIDPLARNYIANLRALSSELVQVME
jgi:zinc transport system substrate-binding protein